MHLKWKCCFGLFWGRTGIEWSEICPRFARKTNWICCCLTLQVLFTFIFFISINSMYIIHSKLHVKHSLNAPVALAVDNALHQRHLRSIHDCWSPQTRWNITKDIYYILGHAYVQSCLLIIFQYHPISLQFSWLSVEQPNRIWHGLVLYKHHWEFPIAYMIRNITMLTSPIHTLLPNFTVKNFNLYLAFISKPIRWRWRSLIQIHEDAILHCIINLVNYTFWALKC